MLKILSSSKMILLRIYAILMEAHFLIYYKQRLMFNLKIYKIFIL